MVHAEEVIHVWVHVYKTMVLISFEEERVEERRTCDEKPANSACIELLSALTKSLSNNFSKLFSFGLLVTVQLVSFQ